MFNVHVRVQKYHNKYSIRTVLNVKLRSVMSACDSDLLLLIKKIVSKFFCSNILDMDCGHNRDLNFQSAEFVIHDSISCPHLSC